MFCGSHSKILTFRRPHVGEGSQMHRGKDVSAEKVGRDTNYFMQIFRIKETFPLPSPLPFLSKAKG